MKGLSHYFWVPCWNELFVLETKATFWPLSHFSIFHLLPLSTHFWKIFCHFYRFVIDDLHFFLPLKAMYCGFPHFCHFFPLIAQFLRHFCLFHTLHFTSPLFSNVFLLRHFKSIFAASDPTLPLFKQFFFFDFLALLIHFCLCLLYITTFCPFCHLVSAYLNFLWRFWSINCSWEIVNSPWTPKRLETAPWVLNPYALKRGGPVHFPNRRGVFVSVSECFGLHERTACTLHKPIR